jgi:iron-sulfur cluster repair protein YtfE (RIC family)
MKATALLKKDHESVKKLFSEFEKAGDRAVKSKAALAEKISAELEVHATIEEEIFYPSVKAARSKKAKAIVAEAYEEHKRVKSLLQKLSKMDINDGPAYSSAMTELKEHVEHHVEEEEGEMFGDAEEHLGDERLEELGEQLKERKAELKAQVKDDG